MKKKGTISRMLEYILFYKTQVLSVFACAIISSGCVIVSPFIVGMCIDNIAGKDRVNFAGIIPNIILLLSLYVLSSVSGWYLAMLSASVANKTSRDMRRDGFNKITTLPIKFFDSTKNGDLMSKFSNDIDAVNEGLIQVMTQLFSGVITILGSVVFMIAIDLWIAFAVILVAPLAISAAGFISRRSGKLFRQQQDIIAQYNGYIEETVGNFKIVKAFGYEDEVKESASKINRTLYNCGQKSQFYSSLVNPSTRFINNVAYVFVGFIGGLTGVAGGLSIGAISSLLTYSAQFAKPLNEMTGIAAQLQAALAAAERFFILIDEQSEPLESEKPELRNVKGEIEFSEVSFSYDKNTELINNFNIHITKGSMVAVVGSTGAGKTTLVNLLMRFYDLDSGHILIDNQDFANFTRDSVRLAFGMVLQDTWLFSGTVKENIAYGLPHARDEEIISAAKEARAHGFIKRLDNGYDTVLSEDGSSISHGEKQLIAIARAMLVNHPILVLDEATSSIDPRTEQKIQHALQKLIKNKTSFIIAHRLSTIENADIILVMDKGKIIETGTHIELLQAKGYYANLYNSQFILPASD